MAVRIKKRKNAVKGKNRIGNEEVKNENGVSYEEGKNAIRSRHTCQGNKGSKIDLSFCFRFQESKGSILLFIFSLVTLCWSSWFPFWLLFELIRVGDLLSLCTVVVADLYLLVSVLYFHGRLHVGSFFFFFLSFPSLSL